MASMFGNGEMSDAGLGGDDEGGRFKKAVQQGNWPDGPSTGARVKHRVHGGKGVVKLTGAVVEWSDGTIGVCPVEDLLTQE